MVSESSRTGKSGRLLHRRQLLLLYSEALTWFKKALESRGDNASPDPEDVPVYIVLGSMYMHGHGTLQDFSEAAKWLGKAAELGEPKAQGQMAFFYYSGQGVLMNDAKARYWAEKAAAQKNFGASFQLGTIYENGIGVPKDLAKAHHYYKQAVKNGKRDYLIEALRDFENEHHLHSTD